jgi:hypothetical protein
MNNKNCESINNNNNNNNNNINNEIDLKRDSFSDRICDDLCEVLLSYLSFESKIRFECVSKQFQRLIFNKQYIIGINEESDEMKNTLNTIIYDTKHRFLS